MDDYKGIIACRALAAMTASIQLQLLFTHAIPKGKSIFIANSTPIPPRMQSKFLVFELFFYFFLPVLPSVTVIFKMENRSCNHERILTPAIVQELLVLVSGIRNSFILMHKSTHVHCTQAKVSARRMSLCDTEHHFAHRRDKSKNTRSSDSTLNAADMQRYSPYPISNETTATASTTTTKSDSNACVCLAQWIWVRVGRDHNSMRELTTTSRPSVHTRSERDVQNILSYSAYCQLPHNYHSLCFIDKKQQTLNRIWKWNNEAHDNIVTQTLTHSPIVEWKHWRKK